MGDLSKNFSTSEFGGKMSEDFIRILQYARDAYGKGITITSGVRSAEYNAEIGGVPDSAHVPADLMDGEGECGHAADIACNNGVSRYQLIQALLNAGFNRIGIDSDFIHVDTDTRKPSHVIWTY